MWRSVAGLAGKVTGAWQKRAGGQKSGFNGCQSVTKALLIASPEAILPNIDRIESRGWSLLRTTTFRDTVAYLQTGPVPVIILDRALCGLNWRECLTILTYTPHRPKVILLSPVADRLLWDEVIRSGGFDVISTVPHENKVERVVEFAWSCWLHDRESRSFGPED